MLVSELITALQELPADLPVIICAEGGIERRSVPISSRPSNTAATGRVRQSGSIVK